MMKNLYAILAVSAGLALASCATQIKGAQQEFTVYTPGVPHAECEIRRPDNRVRAIASKPVWIDQSEFELEVLCEAGGYESATAKVQSLMDAYSMWNLFTAGAGFGYDYATGGLYAYPRDVTIVMEPLHNVAKKTGQGGAYKPYFGAAVLMRDGTKAAVPESGTHDYPPAQVNRTLAGYVNGDIDGHRVAIPGYVSGDSSVEVDLSAVELLHKHYNPKVPFDEAKQGQPYPLVTQQDDERQ